MSEVYDALLAHILSNSELPEESSDERLVLYMVKRISVRGYTEDGTGQPRIPDYPHEEFGTWEDVSRLDGIRRETWDALVRESQDPHDLGDWFPGSLYVRLVRHEEEPGFGATLQARFPCAVSWFTLSVPGLFTDRTQALVYVGVEGADSGSGCYWLFRRVGEGWVFQDLVMVWVV